MLPQIFKPFHVKRSNLLRIGPNKDGGYVIDKRVISKSKTIITCGLNDDWEFEKDFLSKNEKCKVIAYDHTVDKKFWDKRLKKDLISLLLLKKLSFNKIKDVFKYWEYKRFFNSKNEHHIKKIVGKKRRSNEITINEIYKRYNDTILKVDIEGDEYKIFKDILNNSNKINLLIIEFHLVNKNLKKIISFLKNSKFKLIHIHANNYGKINSNNIPDALELTFINNKKFKISNKKTKFTFPIEGLDFANLKRREDIKLNFDD